MKTKNIFRMLLMAVVLLMGANNVMAAETDIWTGSKTEQFRLNLGDFDNAQVGDAIRYYCSNLNTQWSISMTSPNYSNVDNSEFNEWSGHQLINNEYFEFEITEDALSKLQDKNQWSTEGVFVNVSNLTVTRISLVQNSTGLRTYTLIYEVDNTIYATQNYEANATITPPEDPQKEGHTFTGWDGLPDDMTMPNRNLRVTATFTINSYNLIYKVDGEEYKTVPVEYNSILNNLENWPVKAGHTFSGWSLELPYTMPAHDVEVTGSFTVNKHNITYKVKEDIEQDQDENYEIWKVVEDVEYGTTIVPDAYTPEDGYKFIGWGYFPETMPDYDLVIKGNVSKIYHITLEYEQNQGTVSVEDLNPVKGDYIKISVNPAEGFELDEIIVKNSSGNSVGTWDDGNYRVFWMPEYDVTITVTFKAAGAVTYKVSNANNTQNGSVWADKDTAEAGATVTLGSQPNTGYELDHYVVTGENGTTIEVNGNQFLMPASEVWYSAVFKQIDYTVTITEPTNGTVTADKTTGVHYGEEVTLTVTAAEGYELDVLTVKDANNADVTVTDNKFTMPASNVTVTATFKQTETEPVGPTAPEDIENEHSLWAGTPVTATDGDGHLPETLPASLFADIKAGDTFRVYVSNISNDNWKLWITNSANGWDTQVFSDFAGGNITKDNVGSAYYAEDGYGYFEFTCSAETAASLKANGTQMSFTWMTVIKVSYISNESVEPDTYAITVDSSNNGTVAASAESATEGTEITLTITADEGYELDNLTVKAGNDDVTVTYNKFTMPASDVTITATFKAVAPQYEEGNVTYTLSLGEVFAPAQTVAVNNGSETVAVITYSEPGGNLFNAPRTDGSVSGYTAFTEGNGVNGNKSGGTFYTIVPKYNGTISVAVVLNNGKEFYILEDGTALSDYNGITVATKYSGTYEFDVKAGSSYKIYCSGSKLGFYGFNYTYNTETSATLKSIPALSFASNASATVGTDISSPALSTNPSGLSVTYYSSDTDIATVNSETGEVTPVREGSTTIVAAFAGNGNYFSNASYYSLTVEAEVVEVEYETAPIGSTGYATFSCAKALDFSGVSGISAYVVNSVNGTDAILEKVTGTVAAETGLLIVGSTKDIPVAESGNTYANNLLKPVLGSSQTINGSGLYVLTTWGAGVRFAETVNNGATVEPGHAYLDASASGARIQFINIVWDENATAINAAKAASEGNTVIYNLQGQRIVNPAKGVYIINGKKVAIK